MKKSFYQHIKTSSRARNGFGTFQVSKEIESIKPVFDIIDDNANYRTGTELNIDKNPVCLAHYNIKKAHVFLRSKYIGTERHANQSRPGNYISHSLVQNNTEPLNIFNLFNSNIWKDNIDNEDVLGAEWNINLADIDISADVFLDINSFFDSFHNNKERQNALAFIIDEFLSQKTDNFFSSENKKIVILDDALNLDEWFRILMIIFPPAAVYNNLTFCSWYNQSLIKHCKIIGVEQNYNSLQYLLPPYFQSTVVNFREEQFKNYQAQTSFSKQILTALNGKALDSFVSKIHSLSSELGIENIDSTLNKVGEFHEALHKFICGEIDPMVFLNKYYEDKFINYTFKELIKIDKIDKVSAIIEFEKSRTKEDVLNILSRYIDKFYAFPKEISQNSKSENKLIQFAIYEINEEDKDKRLNFIIKKLLFFAKKYQSSIPILIEFLNTNFKDKGNKLAEDCLYNNDFSTITELIDILANDKIKDFFLKIQEKINGFNILNSATEISTFLNTLKELLNKDKEFTKNNINRISNKEKFLRISAGDYAKNFILILELYNKSGEIVKDFIPLKNNAETFKLILTHNKKPLTKDQIFNLKNYHNQNFLLDWIKEEKNAFFENCLQSVWTDERQWYEWLSKLNPTDFKDSIKYRIEVTELENRNQLFANILNKIDKEVKPFQELDKDTISLLLKYIYDDGLGDKNLNNIIRVLGHKYKGTNEVTKIIEKLINIENGTTVESKHENIWKEIVKKDIQFLIHNIISYTPNFSSEENWESLFKLTNNYPFDRRAKDIFTTLEKCKDKYKKEDIDDCVINLFRYCIKNNHKDLSVYLLENFSRMTEFVKKNKDKILSELEPNDTSDYINKIEKGYNFFNSKF